MKYPLKLYVEWCDDNGYESWTLDEFQAIEFNKDEIWWHRKIGKNDEQMISNYKYEYVKHEQLISFRHHMISMERNRKIDDILK